MSPDADAIREIVRRTRAEQGLPDVIEDPAVLERIAAVIARYGLRRPEDVA